MGFIFLLSLLFSSNSGFARLSPLPTTIKPLTLSEKQVIFSELSARLIVQARSMGYEVTLGEAWRSEAMAATMQAWYAKHGKGIAHSLHTKRLAIDLNLFKNQQFLTTVQDYLPLGEWWEKQSTDAYRCTWGGRFKSPDSDHFSIEHEGTR